MFPVTKDRRRKTVSSGCEDHGQQSRLLFSKRSIPAAVPLLPPPDPAGLFILLWGRKINRPNEAETIRFPDEVL